MKKQEKMKDKNSKNPLYDYPLDEFFSTRVARFLVIPDGYKGVRQRLGKVGEEYDIVDKEDNVIGQGHTYGGIVEPGLRFMLSLNGLLGRMAVVYMGVRSDKLEIEKTITQDLIPIKKIEATSTYQVYNPLNAMIGQEDFKEVARASVKAKLRSVIGNRTLDELIRLPHQRINLVSDPSEDEFYRNPLNRAGVQVQEIYLENVETDPRIEQMLTSHVNLQVMQRAAELCAENPNLLDIIKIEAGMRDGKGYEYKPHFDLSKIPPEILKALDLIRRSSS